jgi:uncharacterized protein YbcV (DUF1398 family)
LYFKKDSSMNELHRQAIVQCAELSAAGKLHFGEVVARLTEAGVERYHCDYSRMETTFYSAEGVTVVLPAKHEPGPIAAVFSAEAVESAVRQSQRGEIVYPEFTRQARAAGCVGYFVQIAGKRVQYFGRDGDVHTEWFPGAKPK